MQCTLGLICFFAVFNNSYIGHHVALKYWIDPVSPSVVTPATQIDSTSKQAGDIDVMADEGATVATKLSQSRQIVHT